MYLINPSWRVALLLACGLTVSATSLAQEAVVGEPLDPALYGPSYIESMAAAIERDLLAPLPAERGRRPGQPGLWVVPSRRATTSPASGEHNVVNKWGDTRMGITFPELVDVRGAYFSGQAAAGAWTTGVRVVGYRDGAVLQETDWFNDIGAKPVWFGMDLRDVDRIEIVSTPVINGAGWYALDDLTYSFAGEPGEIVVDFDDLPYNTELSGTDYAGLTWETGAGSFEDGEAVHAPMVPPDYESAKEPAGGEAAVASGQRGTTPTLVTSFQAVIRGDAGSNSYPPDTDGAIGPNHYVETVNRNFSVYNKETGVRVVDILLGSFLPGSNGDPRVLYDHHGDRWIVLVDDFNTRLYLAVSLTDDPTGSWFKTSFVVSQGDDAGKWPDYPTLGVDEHGIYTAAYMVGGFSGMSIFALDKAPLIAPSPSLGTITAWRNLPWEGAIQPAHTYGSPGGEYLISVKDSNELRVRRVNPPLTAPTLSTLGTVSVPNFSAPPDAQALGSSTPLDTVGDRLMMSVYRDGSLWTCHTVGVSGRAACRWYEIDAASTDLLQYGTVADSSMYYFFPSIMVNQYGSVAMGFTGSNAGMYAACYYTGRIAGDPAGEMAVPVQYQAGAGPHNLIDGYGRNRWGDYSYTTLDPVDQATFWTIQEYGHSNNTWGTYVAALTLNDGDCNINGIPDLCDIDCGAVGEYCDLQGCGGSLDCNNNGVPDECEEDCNGNGIPDDCDLASGTDEDCNENGLPDECDISSGASLDCQPNGIPDECDLAPPTDVTPQDNCADAELVCTGIEYVGATVAATVDGAASCGSSNDTPDVWYYYRPFGSGFLTISLCGSAYDTVLSIHSGCPGTADNQIACNDDYCGQQSQVRDLFVSDGTDYWIRVSGANGATGQFMMTLSGPDCTYSAECNDNGIPDDCEEDCNDNGQPDDCDIAAGTSQDANENGIPDECEGCAGQIVGDANCDGAVDSFDIDAFVLALNDSASWAAAYPDCSLVCVCDCNDDGQVNTFDIDPFVAILTGK